MGVCRLVKVNVPVLLPLNSVEYFNPHCRRSEHFILTHRRLYWECNSYSSSSHALRCFQASVMPLPWPGCLDSCGQSRTTILQSRWTFLACFAIWLTLVNGMTPEHIAELRKETVELFYHGFDNYMEIAFPEDEVRTPPRFKSVDTNLHSCGQYPVYP